MASPASAWESLPPIRTHGRDLSGAVARRRARFGTMLPTRSTYPHRYATPGDLGRRLNEAPAGTGLTRGLGNPRTVGFGVFSGFTQGGGAATWSSRFGFSPRRAPSAPTQSLTSLPPRPTPPSPPPAQRSTPRPTPAPRAASTPPASRGAPAQRRRMARIDEPGDSADPDAAAPQATPSDDGLPDLLAQAREERAARSAPRTPAQPPRSPSTSQPTTSASTPSASSPPVGPATSAPASSTSPAQRQVSHEVPPPVAAPTDPAPSGRAADATPPTLPAASDRPRATTPPRLPSSPPITRPGILGRLLPRRGQTPPPAVRAPDPTQPLTRQGAAQRAANGPVEAAPPAASGNLTPGTSEVRVHEQRTGRPDAVPSPWGTGAAQQTTPQTPAQRLAGPPEASIDRSAGAPTSGASLPAGDALSGVTPAQRLTEATPSAARPSSPSDVLDLTRADEASADTAEPSDSPSAEDLPEPGAGYTPRGTTVAGALGRGLLGSLRSASLGGNRWTFRTVSMNSLRNARVRGEGIGLASGQPASVPVQRLAAPFRPTPASASPSRDAIATPTSATAAGASGPIAETPSPATPRTDRSEAAGRGGSAQRIAGEVGRRAAMDASAPRAVYAPLAAHVRARTRLAGSMDARQASAPALPRAASTSPVGERSAANPGAIGAGEAARPHSRGVDAQRRAAVQRRGLRGSPTTGAATATDRMLAPGPPTSAAAASSSWTRLEGQRSAGAGTTSRGEAMTPSAPHAPGALASRTLDVAQRIAARSNADIVSVGGTAGALVLGAGTSATTGAAGAQGTEATGDTRRAASPAQRRARAGRTAPPPGERGSASRIEAATGRTDTSTTNTRAGIPIQRRAIGRRTIMASAAFDATRPVRSAAHLGLVRAIEGDSILADHAGARALAPMSSASRGGSASAPRGAAASASVQRLARTTSPLTNPAAVTAPLPAIPAIRAETAAGAGGNASGHAAPTSPSSTPTGRADVSERQSSLAARGIEAPASLVPRDAAALTRALAEPTSYGPDAIAGAPVRGASSLVDATSAPGASGLTAASFAPQRQAAQRLALGLVDGEGRENPPDIGIGSPNSRGARSVLALPHAVDPGRPLTAQAARAASIGAVQRLARPAAGSIIESTSTGSSGTVPARAPQATGAIDAATSAWVFRAASGAQQFATAAQRRADDRGFAGIDVERLPVGGATSDNRAGFNEIASAPGNASTSSTPSSSRTPSSGSAPLGADRNGGAVQRSARRHPASNRPGHIGRRGLATAPRDRMEQASEDRALPATPDTPASRTMPAHPIGVPGLIGRRTLSAASSADARPFEAGWAGAMPVGAMGIGGLRLTSTGSASPLALAARASVGAAAVQRIAPRGGTAGSNPIRLADARPMSTRQAATTSSAGGGQPDDTPGHMPAQRRARRAGDAGRLLRAAHVEASRGSGAPTAAHIASSPAGGATAAMRSSVGAVGLGRVTIAGSVGVSSMRAVQRLARRGSMGVAARWEAGEAANGVVGGATSPEAPRPGQSGRRALPRLAAGRTVEVDGGPDPRASARPQGEAAVAAALAQAQPPTVAGRQADASGTGGPGAGQRTTRRGSSRARRAAARAAAQTSTSTSTPVAPAQRQATVPATTREPGRRERASLGARPERASLQAASFTLPRATAPQRTVGGLAPRTTPAATARGHASGGLAGREAQEAVTAVSALAAIRAGAASSGGGAGSGPRGGGDGSLSAADAIQRIRRGRGELPGSGTPAPATSDGERPGGPAVARILGRRGGQAGEVAGLPVGGPGATVAAARTAAADIVQRALSSISFDSRGTADAPGRTSAGTRGPVSSGGEQAQPGARAAGSADMDIPAAHMGSAPVQRIVSERSEAVEGVPERGLSEQQIAAIMQALEDRVLAMIERRGGRYRGTF